MSDDDATIKPHRMYSRRDAAAMLGLTEGKFRLLYGKGEIPYRRIGEQAIMFTGQDLIDWIHATRQIAG